MRTRRLEVLWLIGFLLENYGDARVCISPSRNVVPWVCCAVGSGARCLTLWNILCVLRVTNVYIIRSLSMLTGVFLDGGVMVKVQHVRGSGAGTLEIALEGDHIVNRRVTRGGQPHRSENNSNTHRSAYGLLALRVLI